MTEYSSNQTIRKDWAVSASHARLFGACGCVSGREGPETNEEKERLDGEGVKIAANVWSPGILALH